MSKDTSSGDGKPASLSVVIPAFNEEARLPPTLEECARYLSQQGRVHEILVVDDGSSDDTLQVVVAAAEQWPVVRAVSVFPNQGKGNAVRTGVRQAQHERVLFMDADGSTPMAELEKLDAAINGGSDLAIGSRALPSNETQVRTSIHRKLLGRTFNAIANALVIPDIRDTQCGFKLFTADVAKYLFSLQRIDRFGFDIELLYLAQKSGLKISEVPVNWTNVAGSRVNLVLDAADMFLDLFRILWWHRSVAPERFREFLSENRATISAWDSAQPGSANQQ